MSRFFGATSSLRLILLIAGFMLVLVENASAGNVSARETSEWIASHLPIAFVVPEDGTLWSYSGSYVPRVCSLDVSVNFREAQDPSATPDDSNSVYVVEGEAAPGKEFDYSYYFYGELDYKAIGTIDFSLIDQSSLRLDEEPLSFTEGISFGSRGFGFAFYSEDDANRMLRAMRYLAIKCGAEALPF